MRVLKLIIYIILSIIVVCVIGGMSVFAEQEHEDPTDITPIFSAITLFRYYTETLDQVLAYNPDQVNLRMEKMSFANLPESLSITTGSFTSSVTTVANLVVAIDDDLQTLGTMIEQSRISEIATLAEIIINKLFEAESMLDTAEQSVIFTGGVFEVPYANPESALREAYNETLYRIALARQLIENSRQRLASLLQLKITDITPDTTGDITPDTTGDITPDTTTEITTDLTTYITTHITTYITSHIATELSLDVEPQKVFVGDTVRVYGTLQSSSGTLGGREIGITLNGSQYGTAITNKLGKYEIIIKIPYQYTPEMRVQAFYYPKNDDIGVYLAATSDTVKIDVLFYTATITLELEKKAYPGLKTTVSGRLNYDEPALPIERTIELYSDNMLIAEVKTSDEFSVTMELSPDIAPGKHIMTAATTGKARYAPVTTLGILEVSKSPVVLSLDTPKLFFVPGTFSLNGKLSSELGPVPQASITFGLDKAEATAQSTQDGSFATSLKIRWSLSLIGSQILQVGVVPKDPWYNNLTFSKKIFMVNIVNCAVFLFLVIFFGVVASRKIKMRISFLKRQRERVLPLPSQPVSEPEYSQTTAVPAELVGAIDERSEPRNNIIFWYVAALRLAQKAAKTVIKSQQTLREFAAEIKEKFGPIGDYFMELTRMVEKLLYSKHIATNEDIDKSRLLSRKIQDGLRK
ncbi:MAG: DUF4129 domain-containing protein [Dehalococcoidales bacterium]|nr:DUF4129 domain-containing protein [Dehalococcoidales bacterium]